MSDSKGAAIDKIIGELQWRTVNKDGERGAELAKQAILALLAQEVKRKRVKIACGWCKDVYTNHPDWMYCPWCGGNFEENGFRKAGLV